MTKDEKFQEKVQRMTQDPNFMAAAGQYAEEMKDELVEEANAAKAAGTCRPYPPLAQRPSRHHM